MSTLLTATDVSVSFPVLGGFFRKATKSVKAVNKVSFSIKDGETIGIVGESGCGKTSLGRAIVRLYKPNEGRIVFRGDDITELSSYEMRSYRKEIQMIFQDPYASLNPRMSIQKILEEPFRLAPEASREERQKRILDLLNIAGLDKSVLERFPHEFSGGQRQRISIARTLVLRPTLIVADEPVSALDVSIQSQILNLLKDLQSDLNLTYIFISHDLGVVRYIADKVLVMYLGNVVEESPTEELFKDPQHPYTKALLDSIPKPNPRKRKKKILLEGDIPSPMDPPAGCPFHTRCPMVKDRCKKEVPKLAAKKSSEHKVSCHYV